MVSTPKKSETSSKVLFQQVVRMAYPASTLPYHSAVILLYGGKTFHRNSTLYHFIFTVRRHIEKLKFVPPDSSYS